MIVTRFHYKLCHRSRPGFR